MRHNLRLRVRLIFRGDSGLFQRNNRYLSCENFHLFGNLYCYCVFKLKNARRPGKKKEFLLSRATMKIIVSVREGIGNIFCSPKAEN